MAAGFHPVLLLLGWLLLAIPFARLAWAFPLLVLLVYFPVWPIVWQSCRRMKWLLLAMVLSHGWALPGPALLSAYAWSPSLSGLRYGLEQALHLLWLVCGLRYCWQLLGRQGMWTAFSALLSPLRLLGLPVERLLLRLTLTMQLAEYWMQHPPRWRLDEWQRVLAEPPPQVTPDEVKLLTLPWTWRDSLLLLILLAVSFLLWNLG